MAKRILITGGAGFIGSHLADALLADGHSVRVLDSLVPQVHGDSGQRPPYLHPDVDLVAGDVRVALEEHHVLPPARHPVLITGGAGTSPC